MLDDSHECHKCIFDLIVSLYIIQNSVIAKHDNYIFQDPEQLELLREFMKLQKEMMIMLLSMLEGDRQSSILTHYCFKCCLLQCFITRYFTLGLYKIYFIFDLQVML